MSVTPEVRLQKLIALFLTLLLALSPAGSEEASRHAWGDHDAAN